MLFRFVYSISSLILSTSEEKPTMSRIRESLNIGYGHTDIMFYFKMVATY
jgi:hypothetical protein